MKYYLLKNDTSKKISEMEVIEIYDNYKDVPLEVSGVLKCEGGVLKKENTILTYY